MRELLGPEAAKIAYLPSPPTSIAPCCDSEKESTQLIVGVILIHLFLFYVILGVLGVYLMLRNCAQSRNDEETPNGQTMGVVDASQLEYPTLLFSAEMKMSGEAAECSICLLEFVEGERIRVLTRCKHGFHVNCIQPWLSCHSSCPTCRTNTCLPSPSSSPSRLDPGGVNEFPAARLDTDSSQRGMEQV